MKKISIYRFLQVVLYLATILGLSSPLPVLAGSPILVFAPSETSDLQGDITLTFDRDLNLLDPGAVTLYDATLENDITGITVTVDGENLVIEHAGLQSEHAYRILLNEGAIADTIDGDVNARLVAGLFAGTITLLHSPFTNGAEGWSSTGRWTWDSGSINGDSGYMQNGSSEATKHAKSPVLNLFSSKSYQLNIYTSTTANKLMVGLAESPFSLDLTQPNWESDLAWQEIGRWNYQGTRKATFSPAVDGDHHLLITSVDVQNATQSSAFDNVWVKLAVPPQIIVNSPTYDSSFVEGTSVNFQFDILEFTGTITSVSVYDPLDDRTIATYESFSPEGYEFDWSYFTTPGTRDLVITATDNSGLVSTETQRISITLSDGSLPQILHYDFDQGLEGWTGAISRKGNTLGPGSNGLETSPQPAWFASPKVFLFAGETYRISFDHKALRNNSGYIWGFLPYPTATYPENETPLTQFLLEDVTWTNTGFQFTVPVDGGYHLLFWETARNISQSEIAFDNIRLEGTFNSAPQISLIEPAEGIISVVGGQVHFRADVSDLDGSVSEVRFMRESRILNVDTTAPFEFDWTLPTEGEMVVHAVAYDNNNGFTATEPVTISVEKNRLDQSTYLGNSSNNESIRQVAYLSDGTLAVAAIMDPEVLTNTFPSVTPIYVNGSSTGDRGIVALFSEDGNDLQSVTVVGTVAVDLSTDANDNLYVALGSDGAVKLNSAADTVLWSHQTTSKAHRIDAGDSGTAAILYSPQSDFDDKQLSSHQIFILDASGNQLGLTSGIGTYTTDLCIDESSQTVIATGFKNINTNDGSGNSFPVDIPNYVGRAYDGTIKYRGYDWGGTNDGNRWLNVYTNNMADTRGARCVIGEDGFLYVGFEFDGGNSPLRFDPFDLSKGVQIVGGDNYHLMANTSTVPKVFIGRYIPSTGDYVLGQWTTARKSDGGDNTLRLDRGDFYVDKIGRVHIVGEAFANIDLSIDHFPGGYRGGSYYLVLSPDFKNRELWVRFNQSGFARGISMAPSGRIALGGDTDSEHFLTNAIQPLPGSTNDAFLVVGDFIPYFSFQIGEHPRLFFDESDIADLREKLNEEPFQSMYQSLLFERTLGNTGSPYNSNVIYDVALRAQIDGFLYTLTGDEAYAQEAKALVEEVLVNTEFPWADPSTKGLALFWLATRVAITYDWCVNSDAWDEAFSYTVSAQLLNAARVIINNGGTEQNTANGSNWQGARGAAGGLALLASDHVYSPSLAESAWSRVDRYVDEAYAGSGWLSEGTGYFYFPVGNYVGPYGIALNRQNSQHDLRDYPAFQNAFWAAIASNVSHTRPFGWPGVRPDWSDDNPGVAGEGTYGLGFYYLPDSLQQPYKYVYDATQGMNSPYFNAGSFDEGLWDGSRGGTIWSYLYYPVDTIPVDPTEVFAWHDLQRDPEGNGIFTWRDQYEDGSDLLAQFKARLSLVDGHDAPDGLGFRIIAENSPLVVGGGRNSPGRNIGQATVYPSDPSSIFSTNENLGQVVGTPLLTHRGDGHIIAQMSTNNVLTTNHKRWFVSNFDSAQTGAAAAFLIADTTGNGQYWNISTYAENSVSIIGNTFTVTDNSGTTMKGTVLYPTSGYNITTGLRERGSSYGFVGGVYARDADPVLNPPVENNRFVQISSVDGDFLIALTVVKGGETHPAVMQTSGTVPNAVVEIGSLEISLLSTDVLYNGQSYSYPNANITFDAGAHGTIASGSAQQAVAYGSGASAPLLNVESGYIFNGWDKAFDAVVKNMIVTATYLGIESTPSAPDRLKATSISSIQIDLEWRDKSIGETGFVLERSFDGSSWETLANVAAEITAYTDDTLTASTLAYYRVKAVGMENDSAWSSAAFATTLPPNSAPVFENSPSLQAHEGIAYFDTILTSDEEDDSLTISAVTIPAWLSLNDFGDGSADLVGTPDASETGDHLVTLSVSDGINAAVEISFTINVNAKPVVSLDSPQTNPVLLPSAVGLWAEVTVTDETANTVTWSQISGPGVVTFDSPDGLINGMTATEDGEYIVRASATDGILSSSFDLFITWGASANQAAALTLVDFAYSDLPTGDFRNQNPGEITGLDLDGDGNDDSLRFYNFREDIPFGPGNLASPDDRKFYGGLTVRVKNGTTGLGDSGVSNGSENDGIVIRYTPNSPAVSNLTGVFFWDKSDFRNGANSAVVSLGTGSELNLPSLFDVFGGSYRWLIRNGSQYYVSQTQIGNNSLSGKLDSSEIALEMWVEFNPVLNSNMIDFDEASASFDTSSAAFDDLTGVGLIWDIDTYSGSRRWSSFATFKAVATVETLVNRGPSVFAGANAQTEPGISLSLFGTTSDEGLPLVPGSLSSEWTQLSGPSAGNIASPSNLSTTFTSQVPGIYLLRLSVDDGSIQTFSDLAVDVVSNDPYLNWISAFSAIPTGERGYLSDYVGDGIEHLMKYAFDLDPTVSHENSEMYQLSVTNGRLKISVNLANQKTNIQYLVEVADDPDGLWTIIAKAVGGNAMAPASGVSPVPEVQTNGSTVVVSDIVNVIESNYKRRFGRVRVNYSSGE